MSRAAAIALLLLFLPPPAMAAELLFYDALALKGSPVMLKAETRGRFFRKGGELVRFYIDEKPVGQSLSGGDGVALKEFRPLRYGLYLVRAASGDSEDRGVVLSLKKDSALVFVDVVGALSASVLSREPRPGAQQAIEGIIKKHPVVYLKTEFIGIPYIRGWLKENGFPDGPLLDWKDGRLLSKAGKLGLKIKAVVGGPSVAKSASKHTGHVFTFDKSDEGRKVKDWEEIVRSILSPPAPR